MNLDQNLRKQGKKTKARILYCQSNIFDILPFLSLVVEAENGFSLQKRTTKTKRTEIKTLHFSELDSLVLFLTTEE